MSDRLDVSFASLSADPEATLAVLAADGLDLGPRAKDLDGKTGGAIAKAAAVADFKGKYKSSIEILAPAKVSIDRLIVCGIGKTATLTEQQLVDLGGAILAQLQGRKGSSASVLIDIDGTDELKPEMVAALIAQGAMLRHYTSRNI